MTTKKTSHATLEDVAQAAGVSRSTASRALNGSPRISEETTERIEAAAKQLGFVLNSRGRALAIGRSETVAVLITEPLDELFQDPTYSVIFRGISERLSETMYLPILLQATSQFEKQRVKRHIERKSFDAIIDITPYRGQELLEVMKRLSIPVVLTGQIEDRPYEGIFSSVYSDDIEGGSIAAEALARSGRSMPIAILGPRDNPASIDRLAGYRKIFGNKLTQDRIIFTKWDTASGFTETMKLLKRRTVFDSVLAGSDRIAAGVIEALTQTGKKIPEDISIIGYDDHPISQTTTPPLTTIRQPLLEEGRLAAETALEMIQGSTPKTHIQHAKLIIRRTLEHSS